MDSFSVYTKILKKELVPAMGCTEPITLAYCAAKARATLEAFPTSVEILASGNIIKNVKSVIVPHTGGRRGVEVAAAIGIIAGNEQKALEVLVGVTKEQIAALDDYINSAKFSVKTIESKYPLDVTVRVSDGTNSASVRIARHHTDIVLIEKNGKVIEERTAIDEYDGEPLDYSLLNVKDIFEYATTLDISDVKEVIERQISLNTAVSEEGLKNKYGANIGSVLLCAYGDGVCNRAKAAAAAGSDARMNGCELPVIINSGSGNQGMTVSLPVIEYAKHIGASHDTLIRALVISNLLAIRIKYGIGTLSAYCGAVSAGAAAGAAIAYMLRGTLDAVEHTLVNALAITSGIICDGAKASCAAKIATAIDAGLLGYEMYVRGQQFMSGDGIVAQNVEKTIDNVGKLSSLGMKETDKEILSIMTCFD